MRLLAHKLARRFYGYGIDPDDLYQEGMVGLLDALKRYDPSTGYRAWTFARPRSQGRMYDFIREWSPLSRKQQAAKLAGETLPETLPLRAAEWEVFAIADPFACEGAESVDGPWSFEMECALRVLSERERDVVEMYYLRHMTMKQIGDVIGISESKISLDHSRAVQKLKEKILLDRASPAPCFVHRETP